MKLLHFIREDDEFVVLCADDRLKETIEGFSVDGHKVNYVGDVTREKGSESLLPTDRALVH